MSRSFRIIGQVTRNVEVIIQAETWQDAAKQFQDMGASRVKAADILHESDEVNYDHALPFYEGGR